MGGSRRGACARRQERSGAGAAACRRARSRPARSAPPAICQIFFTGEARAAPAARHQGDRDRPSAACRAPVRRTQARPARCSSAATRVACRDRTRGAVTIADAVIARYQAAKDRRGLLDYDDLIDKTLGAARRGARRLGALQARPRHRPCADRRGAGHQPEAMGDHPAARSPNSSPAPARAIVKRTIFAVGDEKQSIFSFQGAAPREFDVMQRDVRARCRKAVDSTFATLRFRHSFRSGPNVLGAVDEVFGRPEAFAGVTADPVRPCMNRSPTPHPGWSRSGTRSSRRTNARSRPGMRRSIN